MTYTKHNIVGLEFQFEGKGTIYTISCVDNIYTISWGYKQNVNYQLDMILGLLNNNVWIPINKPSNEIVYEIY